MEFQQYRDLEKATLVSRSELFRIGMALMFIIGIMLFTMGRIPANQHGVLLVIAAMIGGYMAMNIGANDVANNVGPAVGSSALTMTGAIIIAIIFESSGALIAGGDVVSTIKKGVIDPAFIPNAQVFIWAMMAALLAAALWLNLATAIGAPVSTTHSIVGGVLGAGIAAGGWGIANWNTVGQIVASWVISPIMGGVIAAIFLYFIKRRIIYQRDRVQAAQRVVPWLIALMTWAFSTYIVLKGFKHLIKVDFPVALGLGFVAAIIAFLIVKPILKRKGASLENSRESINKLFVIPLIFSAALLSFAHGANDTANAVGPLAAINDSVLHAAINSTAGIPLWVMLVGAIGISLGLALYGPKLIRTVGTEITDLDQTRAFCVALAAAITVIIASQLGLPVSSTHIAVGGVFGIGFLREFLEANWARELDEIRDHHDGEDSVVVDEFLDRYQSATLREKGVMLADLKAKTASANLYKKERKRLLRHYRQELVKRSILLKIAAAWVITVPLAGIMAALIYYTIRGMLLVT